jgi:colanic acid/amylovoran biosynthesis glycosyltransferase
MRVAYVVSRFPNPSETFIVRELEVVSADPDIELELFSLFPPKSTFEHRSAMRWTRDLRRPGVGEALQGAAWWMLRSPVKVLGLLKRVLSATYRSPGIAARSLLTVPIALVHARRVRASPIAHVHAHFATYPALAAWICHRMTGVPFSYTAHAHDLYVDDSLLRLTLPEARFVATISEFNRRLIAGYGVETPVELVHCGVDPGKYRFLPRRVPAEGPVSTLCVAGLQEKKGHEVLLEALTAPGLDRLRLRLVGDGPLRGELERLANTLGIESRVEFLGSRDETEVRSLLEEADLFVLPSRVARDGQMEGLPVALMEAVASGVPTVATRLSGIPELISDGETGWLAEPGDPRSLRTKLEQALAEGAPASLDAGRALVERDFDQAESGRRIAGFIERGYGRLG